MENYHSLPYTEADDLTERLEFKFRSWSEFMTNLEARNSKDIFFSGQKESHASAQRGFNSHDSFDEAIKEAKQDRRLSHDSTNRVYENVKVHQRMVIGDEPMAGIDIPAYLSGQPECFEQFVPKKKKVLSKKKHIKEAFVVVTVNAHVKEKELSEYIQAVMEILYRDYLFEKVVVTSLSQYGYYSGKANQLYIDIPYRDVEYLLRTTYADFFRRLFFYLKEQSSSLPSGYGSSLNTQESKVREYVGMDAVLFLHGKTDFTEVPF